MPQTMHVHTELKKMRYLLCFVGATSTQIPIVIRAVGILTWFGSLFTQFSYDFYEAMNLYGIEFLVSQVIWFLNLLAATWGTSYRALPWLIEGQKVLEKDSCYEKTMKKLAQFFRKAPYLVIVFGLVASAVQHTMFNIDGALHMDFSLNSTGKVYIGLQVLRFVSGFHVYAGCILFWIIPTGIMFMSGYSMVEFMDQMGAKMKDREHLLTFKDAITSYSQRANFVKSSSRKTFVVLSALVVTGMLCFGLNAYVFLFGQRHYLHVWHSLLPVVLMVYPLCTAAWVTKQYTMFIITVIKAWVHRGDDESSDEDSEINNKEEASKDIPRPRKRSLWGSLRSRGSIKSNELKNSRSSSTCEVNIQDKLLLANTTEDKPHEKKVITDAEKQFGAVVQAVTAATRFRNRARRPRFNFEKFLSYLESMRPTVGFHIAGIRVTWDLVSTTLFLLFSVVAVFMQESIFGSQKSTF